MKNKKNYIYLSLIITLLSIFTLFIVFNNSNNLFKAEEKKYQTVEYAHNKSGVGKTMVEKNFSSKMMLEELDNNAYILYTNINNDLMTNYNLKFVDNKKTINTSFLDKEKNIYMYGSYIEKKDINKKILVTTYIPQMGREIEIEIQLNNFKTGFYDIYKNAIKNEKDKPNKYFYEFFDFEGKKIVNSSYNVGSFDINKYKLKEAKKINYDKEEKIEKDKIKYSFLIRFKSIGEKLLNLTEKDYDLELSKINFEKAKEIKILYSVENKDGKTQNDKVIKKYVLDKNLGKNDIVENHQDKEIPNLDLNKKPGINIMLLTILLINAISLIIVLTFVFIAVRKNKKNKKSEK